MTLMQEEVKNAKGDIWDVFQWKQQQRKECVPVYVRVCVTTIRGMLQRFKVAITAECSSNGISGTRRAQMAPKSSESLWKGHTKYRATPTYSPTHSLLLTDSSGWFLLGLLVPHQSSECSTIIFFKCVTESRTEMPLKCQTAADLTRGVIDEILTKAEFNKKLVAL